MPLIKSIEQLDDGIRITTTASGVYTITSADVPAQIVDPRVAETAARTWANSKLAGKLGGFWDLRIVTLRPLVASFIFSESPIVGNWWVV